MNNTAIILDDAPINLEPVTNPAPVFVNDWDNNNTQK